LAEDKAAVTEFDVVPDLHDDEIALDLREEDLAGIVDVK
jgi:hypothetical protein